MQVGSSLLFSIQLYPVIITTFTTTDNSSTKMQAFTCEYGKKIESKREGVWKVQVV